MADSTSWSLGLVGTSPIETAETDYCLLEPKGKSFCWITFDLVAPPEFGADETAIFCWGLTVLFYFWFEGIFLDAALFLPELPIVRYIFAFVFSNIIITFDLEKLLNNCLIKLMRLILRKKCSSSQKTLIWNEISTIKFWKNIAYIFRVMDQGSSRAHHPNRTCVYRAFYIIHTKIDHLI